jgi:hypothetical protein
MTVQRFGTSSAPCPNGLYVRHSDYAALEAECADWKRRWQDAVDQASEAITERNHWQANHDNQVSRARFLIERGDIPIERVRAHQMFGVLLALEEAVRAQRAMYEGTSDEDNMSARSIAEALDKIDEARNTK